MAYLKGIVDLWNQSEIQNEKVLEQLRKQTELLEQIAAALATRSE